MKRLTKEERKQVIELLNSGKSLRYISEKMNKGKTTIYYYMRKIRGKKYLPIKINEHDIDIVGEVVGVFAGDGSFMFDKKSGVYKIFFFFNYNELPYVQEFKKVLTKLFNLNPVQDRIENKIILRYYRKQIYEFFKKYLIWGEPKKVYTIDLRREKYDINFKKAFLRGLLDSDGYLTKGKIIFSTVSTNLANTICDLLNELDIQHSHYLYKENRVNRKDLHHIYIKQGSNRELFLNMIKPRNLKHSHYKI